MNKLILENLDAALDDVKMSHAYYDEIKSHVDLILEYRNKIKETEKQLLECIDKLCAELATEIRRLQPNLTVIMKTGGCEVCYRAKVLPCVIKPYDGCWKFDNNDFGNVFTKRYPECKRLDCDIYDLAKAITEHFNNHYRSLS